MATLPAGSKTLNASTVVGILCLKLDTNLYRHKKRNDR